MKRTSSIHEFNGDMIVNHDNAVKAEKENKTIGIIRCKNKKRKYY